MVASVLHKCRTYRRASLGVRSLAAHASPMAQLSAQHSSAPSRRCTGSLRGVSVEGSLLQEFVCHSVLCLAHSCLWLSPAHIRFEARSQPRPPARAAHCSDQRSTTVHTRPLHSPAVQASAQCSSHLKGPSAGLRARSGSDQDHPTQQNHKVWRANRTHEAVWQLLVQLLLAGSHSQRVQSEKPRMTSTQ